MSFLYSSLFSRQNREGRSTEGRPKTKSLMSLTVPTAVAEPETSKLTRFRMPLKKGRGHEDFELYEYYKPISIVGCGAYAVVLKAIDTRTNTTVAIKKNKDVFLRLQDARRILREIKLLRHFEHPNVMPVLDVILPHKEDSYNDVYIVMPFYKATLHDITYRARKSLTETHMKWITYQLLQGLDCIHEAGVTHRDLKPENILIDPHGSHALIADFGLAKGETDDMTEYVVTRPYRAPEVVARPGVYDNKVDVWSVGCILGELVNGKRLFRASHQLEHLGEIVKKLGTPDDFKWVDRRDIRSWIKMRMPRKPVGIAGMFPTASPECQDLLARLLTIDPALRLTSREALAHPWLAGMERRMQKLQERTGPAMRAPVFECEFEQDRGLGTKFGARAVILRELRDCRMQCTPSPSPSQSPSPLPSLRDSASEGTTTPPREAPRVEKATSDHLVARKVVSHGKRPRAGSY